MRGKGRLNRKKGLENLDHLECRSQRRVNEVRRGLGTAEERIECQADCRRKGSLIAENTRERERMTG